MTTSPKSFTPINHRSSSPRQASLPLIEGLLFNDAQLPLTEEIRTGVLGQTRFSTSPTTLSRVLANLTVLFRMLLFFHDIVPYDTEFWLQMDCLWGLDLSNTKRPCTKVVADYYVTARQHHLLVNESSRTACLLVRLVDKWIELQATEKTTSPPVDVKERVAQWEQIRNKHPGMFFDSRKPLCLVDVQYTPNIYEKTQSMFKQISPDSTGSSRSKSAADVFKERVAVTGSETTYGKVTDIYSLLHRQGSMAQDLSKLASRKPQSPSPKSMATEAPSTQGTLRADSPRTSPMDKGAPTPIDCTVPVGVSGSASGSAATAAVVTTLPRLKPAKPANHGKRRRTMEDKQPQRKVPKHGPGPVARLDQPLSGDPRRKPVYTDGLPKPHSTTSRSPSPVGARLVETMTKLGPAAIKLRAGMRTEPNATTAKGRSIGTCKADALEQRIGKVETQLQQLQTQAADDTRRVCSMCTFLQGTNERLLATLESVTASLRLLCEDAAGREPTGSKIGTKKANEL